MPNHVTNRIQFHCTKEEVDEIVKKLSTYHPPVQSKSFDKQLVYENKDKKFDFGWWNEEKQEFTFNKQNERHGEVLKEIPENFIPSMEGDYNEFPDFNKLIPMPEELQITSGSLGGVSRAILFGGGDLNLLGLSECKSRFEKMDFERKVEDIQHAIKLETNKRKHGFDTWYDWSIKNWGTKWGAYSNVQADDFTFEFQTAWSAPLPIIEKLIELFPKINFTHTWADEDTGYNVGKIERQDGETFTYDIENGSNEAYELAFDLYGGSEYYHLVDGKYEYNEDAE